MRILSSIMGCKQTTIKLPVAVVTVSSPTSTYVKSSMKKSHLNAKGKTEKMSFMKRKPPATNKSVNFDEKVQVKSRTPTPKQTQNEESPSKKIYRRQIPTDDDDDDDDGQTSPISSLDEEIQNDRTSGPASSAALQRNGHWQKKNSVGIKRPTNVNKENIRQSPVNNTSHATDNLVISPGNRFKVRRKVQYSIVSPTSTSDAPVSSTSSPTYRSVVQPSSIPAQRPVPNTNAVFLEHRASISNGVSTPQATYYAFSRRPIDNTTSTDK
jgi:hypothetical protein